MLEFYCLLKFVYNVVERVPVSVLQRLCLRNVKAAINRLDTL